MAGKVEIRNLDLAINNIQNLSTKIINKRLKPSATLACEELDKTVKEYAELTDHSLAQLAAMGHPYSTKSGGAPHPDEFVHQQSGTLYANIEKINEQDGNKLIVASGVSKSKVPYISFLINGTSKMRPRDFQGHAFQKCKDKMLAIIKSGMGKGSR
jgi:HK97 gp10 family phage protein